MRYIPNTDDDCREMLRAIGVRDVTELFTDIPEKIRLKENLKLPSALSEPELKSHLNLLSEKNAGTEYISFLGAGSYGHYIPSVVEHLVSRSEFYTAYTPYQPEISQGTLQGIYEYQTLICQLTDMEITNASMYDGASALAEAVLMANRINNRKEILISQAVHPEYRKVLNTYTQSLDLEIKEIPFTKNLFTDSNEVKMLVSSNSSSVIIQYPNFFGSIEDIKKISEVAREKEALLIVVVVEPIALGILKPPGAFDCDIVVGEGQVFGNPINFGGPSLGIFATKEKYVRNIPGRIVGATTDKSLQRGYVLTMATREQHIRREKATSNICTNQSLCALAASIYLSTLGRRGMKKLAELNLYKANYVKKEISKMRNFSVDMSIPTFNEFVVRSKLPLEKVNEWLLQKNIIGGLALLRFYPEMKDSLLFCVTEKNTKEDIDILCRVLSAL
ncbi:MAG TPA: aminomethyl-transferring glycine dehydrogenase subunit GcvPA [Nitrospinota bacterium]|nr:aminomethyl-transferring glycine dehydrogenase subunit GcvPA [Nitrospinota bacterium]